MEQELREYEIFSETLVTKKKSGSHLPEEEDIRHKANHHKILDLIKAEFAKLKKK